MAGGKKRSYDVVELEAEENAIVHGVVRLALSLALRLLNRSSVGSFSFSSSLQTSLSFVDHALIAD